MNKGDWPRGERIRRLFYRQKRKCFYCGSRMVLEQGMGHTATIDHRNPRMLGGGQLHAPQIGIVFDGNNRVACCASCNARKKNLPEWAFRELLAAEVSDG